MRSRVRIPRAISDRPPQFRSNIKYNHRFRFLITPANASGGLLDVTVNALLLSFGTLLSNATTGYAINQSFKLRRVSVWTPPATQGSVATCTLLWTDQSGATAVAGNTGLEVSDSTNSVTTPAHISAKPPAGSLASWWHSFADPSTYLFQLTAPIGSLIDIDAELVLADGFASASTIYTSSLATGKVVFAFLDLAASPPSWQPVGVSSDF